MNLKKYIVIIMSVVSIYAAPTTQNFSNAFIEVAKIGNPSVVSIVSKKVVDNNYHNFFSPFGNQFPHNDSRNSSMGSGVIINKDEGFIITNNHVIDNSDNITVILFVLHPYCLCL